MKRLPKLRHHQASNQGFVALRTADSDKPRTVYLGVWGKPETEQAYLRTLAEWQANNRTIPIPPHELTIMELSRDYLKHAAMYYVKGDGTPTSELHRVKMALTPLVRLYGMMPAAEFSPLKLETVRQTWIDAGIVRKTVNALVGNIRLMFRWAGAREMIPGAVYLNLKCVESLKARRSAAKESTPVLPVSEADIEAVRSRVPGPVRALIDLQRLTGARAGEVLPLRPCDLRMDGAIWTIEPEDHKTSCMGRKRIIHVGPRGQQLLRPYLLRRADLPMFSPAEAEAERHRACRTHRRPGQPQSDNQTGRTVGTHYTVDSYNRVISRACREAGIPRWSSHRLRHSFATTVRAQFGIEAVQHTLGHAHAQISEVYAERDMAKAAAVVAAIG